MEFMLQAVVAVFMLFLCALCLFAVVVIVRDIIHENAKNKQKQAEAVSETKPDPVQVVVQPVVPLVQATVPAAPVEQPAPPAPPVEPVKEEIPEPAVEEVAITTEVVENPDAVTFSKVTLTMAEKYEMLSSEFKRYFDEIIKHALSKEGVVEAKRASAYDYKIGTYRVVRMTIKRGEIVCEFNFVERDFKNYANEASVRIKQLGTAVKVTETSAVGVVKDGIDLVVSQIAADKEYKKNLAREKRREKRRQEREENLKKQTATTNQG